MLELNYSAQGFLSSYQDCKLILFLLKHYNHSLSVIATHKIVVLSRGNRFAFVLSLIDTSNLFHSFSNQTIAIAVYLRYNAKHAMNYTVITSAKNKRCFMKISYKKLWVMLIQRDITKVTFRKDLGLSTSTMSKLNKGEEVALSVLLRICKYLDCDIGEICEAVRVETE